jgi:hypothetical protein
LCENENDCTYFTQPDLRFPKDQKPDLSTLFSSNVYGAYLDVWERHITHLDQPLIREVALGSADTATRSKVVWQVKLIKADQCATVDKLLGQLNDPAKMPQMRAQLDPETVLADPCITSPDSQYRGAENQLYRVEIHQPAGTDASGKTTSWTFKWSRENGSVVAAWLDVNDDGGLVVSSARGFDAGDWVELTSEAQELNNVPGEMSKIVKVDGDALYLDPAPKAALDPGSLVKIRRWDQRENEKIKLADGALPGIDDGSWLDLEDGIQVAFEPGRTYNSGDYWIIPARVATGQIEWPADPKTNKPLALLPHGIRHHYAPLAILNLGASVVSLVDDCREQFKLPLQGFSKNGA